jgi:hypothetical protein
VSVYIAISLVGGYEPFSISASYQTTTRQNAVDVGGYSYSFLSTPYPIGLTSTAAYESEMIKLLDHVTVRAR